MVSVSLSVRLRQDHRGRATRVQFLQKPVCVERLVGQQRAEGNAPDQRRDPFHVMRLTWQQHEPHEVAERIHQRHDLRRQSAARTPDGLSLSPPFAPIAFWWTKTIVPSMSAYSKSGSSLIALQRISKPPASAHRRNRRNWLFHLPSAGGRSRQGEPVRTHQSTASRNRLDCVCSSRDGSACRSVNMPATGNERVARSRQNAEPDP